MPDNILGPFDKVTMLNSVEGRVPLLDHRIIELINLYNLNVIDHNNFAKNKKILRNLYSRKLPNYIFNNKKIGFDAPLTNIQNFLNRNEMKKLNIFDLFDQKKIEKNFSNKNCIRFLYNLSVYKKWMDYN